MADTPRAVAGGAQPGMAQHFLAAAATGVARNFIGDRERFLAAGERFFHAQHQVLVTVGPARRGFGRRVGRRIAGLRGVARRCRRPAA